MDLDTHDLVETGLIPEPRDHQPLLKCERFLLACPRLWTWVVLTILEAEEGCSRAAAALLVS